MKCLQFKEDHVLSEKIPDSRQLYWAALAAGCSALGFERPMAFEIHNRCNFLNIFNFRPIESHPDGIRVQTHNSAPRQVQCPKRLMMQIKGTLKTCGWFLNMLSLSLSLSALASLSLSPLSLSLSLSLLSHSCRLIYSLSLSLECVSALSLSPSPPSLFYLNGWFVENKSGIEIEAHDCIKHKNSFGTHSWSVELKSTCKSFLNPFIWL